MKVVIGTDSIRYPLTGMGRYTYEVATRLPHVAGIEDVRYFRGGHVSGQLPCPPRPNTVARSSKWLRRMVGNMPLLADAYRRYASFTQKDALQGYDDYVYHGPNYYLPVHDGPSVATFHDLSVFMCPECHPSGRVRYMQKQLPAAIKRASVLLTDSEFTRQEVAAFFSWPLDKIVAAPLAAADEYRPMDQAEITPALSAMGLTPGSYSLFVGTLDPRKNVDGLLDAYERMPDRLRRRHPLIVTGYEGWKSAETIARLRNGEREGWARYLGFVEESMLPSLYCGARVFLYPSRYEGFGLPVLEAMATGVPVICSNAASLPEVAGPEGALQVPAGDPDALYEALARILEDDQLCATLRAKGPERAREFSWDRTVEKVVTAYKLAAR